MTTDNADSPDKKTHGASGNKLLQLIRRTFVKNNKGSLDPGAFEQLDMPQQEMIRGVFNLSEKNARDIMIPRVDIIAIDSSTEQKPLLRLVNEGAHSRLPVFEETIDNIVGILYVKDLLRLLIEKSRRKFQLRKILHAPYFVPETMPLDELLYEFKKRKLHMAIVVDEYGGVGGIVTMEDILEEIVGEIDDEYDSEELPDIQQVSESVWEVDSRISISDFNEKLSTNLDTGDFDTIGGYVYDLFGKIPEKGEEVRADSMTFAIKDIKGTIINRILVTIPRSS